MISSSIEKRSGLTERSRQAHADHERAKTELKGLMPEDAMEAIGHGIRAKRSKSGSVSFDLVEMEVSHASVSESVAAIATAWRRPRLSSPTPRGMVGTTYNSRSEGAQSFRYASLSSDLEIARKALGGQQITIAQTTTLIGPAAPSI